MANQLIDAYGNPVVSAQTSYASSIGSGGIVTNAPNPFFNQWIKSGPIVGPPIFSSSLSITGTAPAATPIQNQITFDTIGQIIPVTLGACLLPLKTIWILGVNEANDTLPLGTDAAAGSTQLAFPAGLPPWVVPGLYVTGGVAGAFSDFTTIVEVLTDFPARIEISSPTLVDIPANNLINFVSPPGELVSAPTVTFAGALCHPLDPTELGNIISIFNGVNPLFSATNGITPPASWSTANQAQLQASLEGILVYPGDEAQLPAPLIVADKGADATNAYRGLRYVIIPNYPFGVEATSLGFPQLIFEWRRSNGIPPPPVVPPRPKPKNNIIAVEFAAGSG